MDGGLTAAWGLLGSGNLERRLNFENGVKTWRLLHGLNGLFLYTLVIGDYA